MIFGSHPFIFLIGTRAGLPQAGGSHHFGGDIVVVSVPKLKLSDVSLLRLEDDSVASVKNGKKKKVVFELSSSRKRASLPVCP